jgi:hypothetical protein
MKSIELLLGLAAISAVVGVGQAPRSAAGPKSIAAPNAWMKTPTDPSVPDGTPEAVRMQRDAVWDGLIGARLPLTPENAWRSGISEGSSLGEPAEIMEVPNRAVLIGHFASFRSILTSSGRAIYTEVTVQASNVFEDISGRSRESGTATVIFPGGTVKTADGQVMSFLTQPRTYFMQPGKTYLLVLAYHADGDFYGFGKDWDVSDGTVRADNGLDRRREREGRSTLIGLSTEQLIRLLSERFKGK